MTTDSDAKLKRANFRLALWLAAVAGGILAIFFWSVTSSGGPV